MKARYSYYRSFHKIPIIRFNRLVDWDLDALVVKGKVRVKKLLEAREIIMNERLKAFGVADTFRQAIELQERACKLRADAYLTGNKHKLNFARIADRQADELLKATVENLTFSQQLAMVSKKMGFRVDPNTITAYEFFSYIYS